MFICGYVDIVVKVYIVNVKIGDVFRGGIDVNVFINIYGEFGNTGERKLVYFEIYVDKFERNYVSLIIY